MAAAPGPGRRGLGLRARGPRRRRRSAGRPGPPDPAAAAAPRRRPPLARRRPWYDEVERRDARRGRRGATWCCCGSTRRSTRATCTRRTCSTSPRPPACGWSTARRGPGAAREARRAAVPRPVPRRPWSPRTAGRASRTSSRAYGTAVVKPVDGFAGIDVWLRRATTERRGRSVESATARRYPARDRAGVPADGRRRQQAAVPARRRDRRRRPPAAVDDDFRIGPPVARPRSTPRDRAIVAALAPLLRRARHRARRPRRHRRPADRGQRHLPRRHAQDRRPARHRPQRRDRAPPARHRTPLTRRSPA